MTTTLQRRGTAIVATILVALALSILSVTTARADPLARVQPAAAAGVPVTPPAGTEGRGGVALLPATPLAGTDGRGGVALLPSTVAAGTAGTSIGSGSATTARVISARMPAPVASAPAGAGWIAGGIAAAALVGGLIAYWAFSRRDRTAQLATVTSISRESVATGSSAAESARRKAA